MALIKHNERSLRNRHCRTCKAQVFYYGHNTSGGGDGNAEWCGEHSTRSWVALNQDGSRHVCHPDAPWQLSGDPDKDFERGQDETASEVRPWVDLTPTPPVTPPAPVATPPASDDRMGALSALLDLLAPKVDAKEVHKIVDQRLAGLVLPLRMEISRDGEIKPVEGFIHNVLPLVIQILNDEDHVIMVGPAGTGKSHIAGQAAEALGMEFGSISLTPQTPTSAITGYMTATGEYVETEFRRRFEHGGVFLFDEVDNGHPSTLGIVNSALANGHMAFPDGMIKRSDEFRCVASANTYGRGPDRAYVGRQALDAAFMDRFEVVDVDVDEALEEALCLGTGLDPTTVKDVLAYVRYLRKAADDHKLPLVFSPRRSRGLCKRLKRGMGWQQAVRISLRRGISDTDWSKVSSGAPRVSI